MAEKTDTVEKVKAKVQPMVYTAEELAKHARKFGVREECVVAAMRYYNKSAATEKEAAELVRRFGKREVR